MKRTLLILAILLMTTAIVFAGGGSQQSTTPTQGGAPVKITVEVFDRGTDGGRTQAANNYYTQWIHDKVLKDLNIDVTFQAVGRWTETTDIVNLLASNSAPDLCITYATEAINTFARQGGILELTPYIDRLLPDFKKLLGKDPQFPGQDFIYRDRGSVEANKMYSFATYVIDVRSAQKNIFIRKDWLDKLGLPIPRTTQQFHDALVAFRDRDPGNVGRNNVVPYAQDADARWGFSPIVYAYFDPKMSARDEWIYSITDRPISLPGYKEGVRLINAWYNEGLIYKDFPLMKVAEDFWNMIKSGRVGAFAGNWDLPWRPDSSIQVEMAKNVPGANFIAIDCIQAPDGITRKYMSDKPDRRIFVPASSKNVEDALRYLNWLSKFDNFNFLQIGNVGITHDLVNGIPQVKAAPEGSPQIMNSPNNIDLTMPINGIELLDNEKNSRVLALSYPGIPPETIVNAMAVSTANGKISPAFSAAQTNIGTYGQTLMDKADALLAQSITTTVANFDRVWDAGYRDWLASGGQAVIDEKTRLAATNPAWR
jgi:putative aldouronate transport system substrate-binding protein